MEVDDNQYFRHRPWTYLDFKEKIVKIRRNFPHILELLLYLLAAIGS